MKNSGMAAILAVGILTSGCGAHNAHANEGVGAILGGVVGGVVGNQIGKGSGRDIATAAGAMIGIVTGANIGKNMENQNRTHTAPPSGHNHASNPCDVYSSPGERSYCLRGLEEREAAEQRRREREAYERGRHGGGHVHHTPSHGHHSYNSGSSFDFVFVWDGRRHYKKKRYHRRHYKRPRYIKNYGRNGCRRGHRYIDDPVNGRIGCFRR